MKIAEKLNIDGNVLIKDTDDRDNDGNREEYVPERMDAGTQDIIQPTELGEVAKLMNEDTINPDTRTSSIDMKTDLHEVEIGMFSVGEFLVSMNALPQECISLWRQLKRNKVSLNRKGRGEFIDLVRGKQEQDIKKGSGGMMNGIKGMMGLQ